MGPNLRALVLAGALAGITFSAAPASAVSLAATFPGAPADAFDHSRFDPGSTSAAWRCRGWGCHHWGHPHWRRNRIDAGDVLLGAVLIGGIAAIAAANNLRARDREVVVVERDRDWRHDWRRHDDQRNQRRGNGSAGLDSALDQCLARIERDVRVDSVDRVERNGDGWLVSGALFNGSPFRCQVGRDGRIEDIDFGGFAWGAAAGAAERVDGQWSDDRYASARAAIGGTVRPDMAVSEANMAIRRAPGPSADAPMPAYPGGPIPGEDIPEPIDGDIGG
jgi:hypothetical protein